MKSPRHRLVELHLAVGGQLLAPMVARVLSECHSAEDMGVHNDAAIQIQNILGVDAGHKAKFEYLCLAMAKDLLKTAEIDLSQEQEYGKKEKGKKGQVPSGDAMGTHA